MIEEGAEDSQGGQDDGGRLKDVISALGGMNIVLSPDTNPSNFLAHLHNALLTAAAHRGEGDANGQPPASSPMEVADQGAVALSLTQRKQIEWADKMHREQVSARLRALLDTGRCTPAEHNQRSAAATAGKLSLADDGQPIPADVEKWIESREAVPQGTFWEPGCRLQKLAVAIPNIRTGELAPEEVEEVSSWALRRKK